MDFGKLASIDGVDFTLPPDPSRTRHVLEGATTASTPPGWLKLGAPAWARRDWLGSLYPPGTPARAFLSTYARALSAIELNATYYSVPDAATLDAWIADTPAGFLFCPKLPSTLTHDRGLRSAGPAARAFVTHMARLGPRLGPTLVQLPATFAPHETSVLAAFLAAWTDPRVPPLPSRPFVELRHPGWFTDGRLRDDVAALLERHDAGAVITDVAGRRDVCHATLTRPEAFIRFVGNETPASDEARANAWLVRLDAWRARGLERAFFFVHQPDDAQAPQLLSAVARDARARGIDVTPVPLSATQMRLF